MAHTAPRVIGTAVRPYRKANRGPCSRCGTEIEYRKDRPGKMCKDCAAVDPMWGKRERTRR